MDTSVSEWSVSVAAGHSTSRAVSVWFVANKGIKRYLNDAKRDLWEKKLIAKARRENSSGCKRLPLMNMVSRRRKLWKMLWKCPKTSCQEVLGQFGSSPPPLETIKIGKFQKTRNLQTFRLKISTELFFLTSSVALKIRSFWNFKLTLL